jgi:threonine 3-dehydrogenase
MIHKKFMKAIVKEKPGPGAVIKEVAIPQLGPHDVLIRVAATSICGTDLHIYGWDNWASARMNPPVVIGHEMSGYIAGLGYAVKNWCQGDYVSLECHRTCGYCYQCRTGQGHICCDHAILGVDFDGCFAEYVRVPETNLWRNDKKIPPEVASLQDPIGNAVMAVDAAGIAGKTILITGCGPVGLLTVGVSRVLGAAKILAADINDYRLNIAETMGATLTINPAKHDLVSAVRAETRCRGIDVIIEASGNEQSLQNSLKVLKNGGQVVLLGLYKDKIGLDLSNEVILKGVTLTGVTGREMFKTWFKTSELLTGPLDVSPVITHRMKLEEYEEAFRLMKSGCCGKIVLYP